MKRVALFAFGLVVCLLAIGSTTLADVPHVINYQGRLTDNAGNPVPDGQYSLTFRMYADADGITDVWLCGPQAVEVADGLFSYPLGETCPLPDNLFAANSSTWLSIAVNEGPESTPLVRMMSVAYSYHALRADTAEYISGSSGGQGWIDAGNVVHLELGSDSVGIGTATPTTKLDVDGTVNTTGSYNINGNRFLSDSGNGNVFVGVHAGQNNTGISNSIIGYDAGVDNSGHNNTFVGRAAGQTNTDGEENTFVGGSAGSANSGGNANTCLGYRAGVSATGDNNTFLGHSAGATATGFGNVYIGKDAGYFETGNNQLFIANSSTSTPLIYGDFDSRQLGFGTTDPNAGLDVLCETGTGIRAQTSGVMVNAIWGLTASSGGSGVTGTASGTTGSGVSGFSTAENGKGVFGHAANDYSYAVYGIALGHASYGFYGEADSSYGIGVYGQSHGSAGIGVYGEATAADGYGVSARSRSENGVALYARATLEGGVAIEAVGGDGGYAGKFAGNVILVDPDNGETLLEMGEGLDYAEGFDHAADHEIEPGTVVIIDKDQPGKLRTSHIAYDNKVAGIVAGAKGLGSGVRLGADRYDMDVALAGRVYCKVDASLSAVEPGDLLTTSSIPGHAMKATDYEASRGAILGKAMESLEKGSRGQILVLVTLQ